MTKIYQLGVLGLGEGRSILSAAGASSRWEVRTMCDLDETLCRQRQAEFGLSRWTTSYDEMLTDPGVDVVAIYTPDACHAEHAERALRAGKHVICTKPLFDGLQSARVVLDAARGAARHVLVGQSCRFFETFLRQRKALEAGRLGPLLSAEAHYHGDKRRGTSGRWGKAGAANWIYTGLVHAVDLIYWHLGPVAEVTGYGLSSPAGKALGQRRPDCFHFVLRAESGALGLASGFFGAPVPPARAQPEIGCTLRGATGVSVASYPEFNYDERTDAGGELHDDYSARFPYYFRFGGHSHHAGEFQNYLEHFSDCLDRGETPRPSLEDGVQVIATLVAMERVLANGLPAKVADVLAEHGLAAELFA